MGKDPQVQSLKSRVYRAAVREVLPRVSYVYWGRHAFLEMGQVARRMLDPQASLMQRLVEVPAAISGLAGLAGIGMLKVQGAYAEAFGVEKDGLGLLAEWVTYQMRDMRPTRGQYYPSVRVSQGGPHRRGEHSETVILSCGLYDNGVAILPPAAFGIWDRERFHAWVRETAKITAEDVVAVDLTVPTPRLGEDTKFAAVPTQDMAEMIRPVRAKESTRVTLTCSPTMEEVLAGLLPPPGRERRPVMLYGASGCGKSMLALEALLRAAQGKRVLIITGAQLLEMSAGVISQLNALHEIFGTGAVLVDDYQHEDRLLQDLLRLSATGQPVALTVMHESVPALPGLRPERMGKVLRLRPVTTEEDASRLYNSGKIQNLWSRLPDHVRQSLPALCFPAAWHVSIRSAVEDDADKYLGEPEGQSPAWLRLLEDMLSQYDMAARGTYMGAGRLGVVKTGVGAQYTSSRGGMAGVPLEERDALRQEMRRAEAMEGLRALHGTKEAVGGGEGGEDDGGGEEVPSWGPARQGPLAAPLGRFASEEDFRGQYLGEYPEIEELGPPAGSGARHSAFAQPQQKATIPPRRAQKLAYSPAHARDVSPGALRGDPLSVVEPAARENYRHSTLGGKDGGDSPEAAAQAQRGVATREALVMPTNASVAGMYDGTNLADPEKDPNGEPRGFR